MTCPNCHNPVSDDTVYCPHCNWVVAEVEYEIPEGYQFDPSSGLYYFLEPGRPTLWYDPDTGDYQWETNDYDEDGDFDAEEYDTLLAKQPMNTYEDPAGNDSNEYMENPSDSARNSGNKHKQKNTIVIALVAVFMLGGIAYATGLHESLPFLSGSSQPSRLDSDTEEAVVVSDASAELPVQSSGEYSEDTVSPEAQGQAEVRESTADPAVEADPGKALRAYLLTLQGQGYNNNEISRDLTQQAYENMLAYYGEAADFDSVMGARLAGLDDYLFNIPQGDLFEEAIIDVYSSWASLCEWNVEGYTFENESKSRAAVTVTITRRVNGDFIDMELYEKKVIQLVERDYGSIEEFSEGDPDELERWLINVFPELVGNPEEIGMLDTQTYTYSVEMKYDSAGGWVTADTDEVLSLLMVNVLL